MKATTRLTYAAVCVFATMTWFGNECRGWSGFAEWNRPPDIFPEDAFIFIGETINITYQLPEGFGDVNISDVDFKVTHLPSPFREFVIPKPWIVPRQNVRVVDNRTVYASITATEQFTSAASIACMNGNTKLTSTYLYTEKPLRGVLNFTGINYFDESILKLTWRLGQTYLDEINNIKVIVDWSPNTIPPDTPYNLCEDQKLESCSIQTTGQDIIFVRVNVSIQDPRLTGRDTEFLTPLYNTSTASIIRLTLDEIVKTSPPADLQIVNVNSTCADITWTHYGYFRSCTWCDALYQLKITTKDTEMVEPDVRKGIRKANQQTVQVCDLAPFTNYTLSLEIKAHEVNPWSEAATIEVTTNEDRPLDGPPVTDTSFHTGPCIQGTKEVTVYWKYPPKSSVRGMLTKFEVVVGNKSMHLRPTDNSFSTKLRCNSVHEILVYSATNVGLSVTPSKIIIPIELLTKVNDFTVGLETDKALSTQNAVAKWDPDCMRGQNVSFILYMCRETNFPYTCLDDFQTSEVAIEAGQLSLLSLPKSSVIFGYALRDEHGLKRGIEWASCVYQTNLVPDKLSFIVQNRASALLIIWNHKKCDRSVKVLTVYHKIYICPGIVNRVTDSCYSATVNSSEQLYLAKGLEGGKQYSVFMQAVSPAGPGPVSNPHLGIPHIEKSDFSSSRGRSTNAKSHAHSQ